MTQRNKIGVAAIIALFVVLLVLLWTTFRPAGDGNAGYGDNIFVKQRIVNLNK